MLMFSGIVFGTLIQLALCRSADAEFGYREVADDGGLEAAETWLETAESNLEADSAGCPADFKKTSHGSCFKIVQEKKTWANAAVRCKSFHDKAHLAILSTAVKQHDLQAIIPHDEALLATCGQGAYDNSFWIGAQRLQPSSLSSFVWRALRDDGTEDYIRSMTYNNWASGQPSGGRLESCGAIHSAIRWGYQWDDFQCEARICSICEIDQA